MPAAGGKRLIGRQERLIGRQGDFMPRNRNNSGDRESSASCFALRTPGALRSIYRGRACIVPAAESCPAVKCSLSFRAFPNL